MIHELLIDVKTLFNEVAKTIHWAFLAIDLDRILFIIENHKHFKRGLPRMFDLEEGMRMI